MNSPNVSRIPRLRSDAESWIELNLQNEFVMYSKSQRMSAVDSNELAATLEYGFRKRFSSPSRVHFVSSPNSNSFLECETLRQLILAPSPLKNS